MENIIRVLIPDAESGHTIWVCEGLAMAENIEIHGMSRHSNSALKYSKKCKSFKRIFNFENDSNYLNSILEYALEINADIILPIDEPLTELFSKNINLIHERFKTIPIPESDSFKIATNKRLLAEFCQSKNIPVPLTYDLNTFNYLLESSHHPNFPIIIKPESGNGGRNVFLLNSKEEFENFNPLENNKDFGQYFVQEYIDGYDIDMSVLCKEGKILAYTIQKGIIKRKSQFAASLGIQFLEDQKLYKIVEKLINELKYNGIAHIDLRYDFQSKNYKIIEINSRFWGSVLGSILNGVNFPYLSCIVGMTGTTAKPFQKHNRFFDFISIIKKPKDIFKFSVKLKETNLSFLIRDPFAHAINVFRRI